MYFNEISTGTVADLDDQS